MNNVLSVKLWIRVAVCSVVLAAKPVLAAPIVYTLAFDASNIAARASGESGVGSFVYDAATDPDTMTNRSS